jgi:hypothetical protein
MTDRRHRAGPTAPAAALLWLAVASAAAAAAACDAEPPPDGEPDYGAVSRLRKLGLGAILAHRGGGYLLRADTPLLRARSITIDS